MCQLKEPDQCVFYLVFWTFMIRVCASEAVAEQGSGPNRSPAISQNKSSSETPADMEGKRMRLSEHSAVPAPRVPVRVRNGHI